MFRFVDRRHSGTDCRRIAVHHCARRSAFVPRVQADSDLRETRDLELPAEDPRERRRLIGGNKLLALHALTSLTSSCNVFYGIRAVLTSCSISSIPISSAQRSSSPKQLPCLTLCQHNQSVNPGRSRCSGNRSTISTIETAMPSVRAHGLNFSNPTPAMMPGMALKTITATT